MHVGPDRMPLWKVRYTRQSDGKDIAGEIFVEAANIIEAIQEADDPMITIEFVIREADHVRHVDS